MERMYKYRFYPTAEQAELLAQMFGCVHFVYSSILRWHADAYYEQKEKIGYLLASACLTALKEEPEYIWLNDVSCVPLQRSLRHQQAAFADFFARRTAYPALKSKRHKRVTEFIASAFKHRDGELYIAKSKSPLDVRWSRELPPAPSTVTISRDNAGRCFAPCLRELEPVSIPVTAKTVDIDMGLKDLFVTDIGFKTDNPRHTTRYTKRLTLLQ